MELEDKGEQMLLEEAAAELRRIVFFCYSALTNEQTAYQCRDQTAEMSAHLTLCFVCALCSRRFCLAHCYPALGSLCSVRRSLPANVLIK